MAAQAHVGGALDKFFGAAKLLAAARPALAQDVLATGAASVQELGPGDRENFSPGKTP